MDNGAYGLEAIGDVNVNKEKAWYVFTVLARLGRASTADIVSDHCHLVRLNSAEVKDLCYSSDSPISVSEDGLISFSQTAIAVVHKFNKASAPETVDKTCFSYSRKRAAGTDICDRPIKIPKIDQQFVHACNTQASVSTVAEAFEKSSSPLDQEKQHEIAVKGDAEEWAEKDTQHQVSVKENADARAEKYTQHEIAEKDNADERTYSGNPTAMNHAEKEKAEIGGTPSATNDVENDKAGENPTAINDFDVEKETAAIGDRNCSISNAIPGNSSDIPGDKIRLPVSKNATVEDLITSAAAETVIKIVKSENNCDHFDAVENLDNVSDTESKRRKTETVLNGRIDAVASSSTVQKASKRLKETDTTYHDSEVEKDLFTELNIGSHKGGAENLKKDMPNMPIQCKEIQQGMKDTKPTHESPLKKLHTHISRSRMHISREKVSSAKRKLNRNEKVGGELKDENVGACPSLKENDIALKDMPSFEFFTIEDEQGSGGYGTVYRVRRKHDGKIFAIKCPLNKTPVGCVKNEIKMLQRFGGKSCIIKYEGFVKDHNSNCIILEYVEHDKPEVLRREISISEIRWYGYCLFRALQELHKYGIIHRDVKPGNFLFSRITRKGYLIDFNLAVDQLEQCLKRAKPKIYRSKKPVVTSEMPPVFSRALPDNSRQKTLLSAANVIDSTKKSSRDQRTLTSAAQKRQEHGIQPRKNDSLYGNYITNKNKKQKYHTGKAKLAKGTDMQLLMSPSQEKTKDLTSTRTSGSKKPEPLPSQGRKELLNLLTEVRQSTQDPTVVSVSQKKRVIASPERAKPAIVIAHVSPMPTIPNLNSTLTSLGQFPKDMKVGREGPRAGPCVGTKGYRAPEVLLKSLYQGPKMDIWSAGVSLLYLIMGKAPLQAHSTEQAIKDIAKLFGKEAIWELAKLHDRESSLPEDLYACSSQGFSIEEWCRKNTKRPELVESIPSSLFDLISKCLCINPRLRIDADEALRHEFFVPCQDGLQKQSSKENPAEL